MRKKNYKGRCEKKSVPKCNEIFKAYDAIQNAYVDVLSSRNDIVEIRCNVPLEDMRLFIVKLNYPKGVRTLSWT